MARKMSIHFDNFTGKTNDNLPSCSTCSEIRNETKATWRFIAESKALLRSTNVWENFAMVLALSEIACLTSRPSLYENSFTAMIKHNNHTSKSIATVFLDEERTFYSLS